MVGWPVDGRWSLWKTTNAGNTWDSSGLYIPEIDPTVWSFENSICYINNRIWFGGRNKGLYSSSDNGTSWSLQELGWTGYAYPSAVWFENSTHGFSSADRNIIKTETGGLNWTIMPNTSGAEIIKGITGAGNNWWYVRFLSNKIFCTTNDGDTWYPQYTAPSNSGYNHITRGRNGSGRMWAARIDGGISVYNGPSGITNISSEIPDKFILHQNYPNPFNPITKILFVIPAKAGIHDDLVRLTVYNTLGQEVKTLVNESAGSGLSPGTYEVSFDGSNLSSGIYYYTLKFNENVYTKKMVLLK
jgi:hypothetical protein